MITLVEFILENTSLTNIHDLAKKVTDFVKRNPAIAAAVVAVGVAIAWPYILAALGIAGSSGALIEAALNIVELVAATTIGAAGAAK